MKARKKRRERRIEKKRRSERKEVAEGTIRQIPLSETRLIISLSGLAEVVVVVVPLGAGAPGRINGSEK